ncbi:shikimate dehydrogenase family protein [Streptomyces phaeoluteigriseus]|uniref:shikimate dehydrogenase family protein n=1 Tax=Streptomyces phaeoluteigriseus TaxID=114686 RepID=UPI0036814EF0
MPDALPDPSAISGTTRLYVVLGDPVAQVRAPGLLNDLFARTARDAVLVPVHVGPEGLGEVMRGLRRIHNLDGILVTVPHKIEVCRYADLLGPAAEVAGSANALRRNPDGTWLADNFDGVGFVHGLRANGHDPAGATVALAGAGGAGRAVAAALLTAGVAQLRLYDPDSAREQDVLARLDARWPGRVRSGVEGDFDGEGDHEGGRVDIAVNATPLGMRPGDPLPFDPARLPRTCVVADIIMKPAETALLKAARDSGRPVVHGRHMLDSQVLLYQEFFALHAPERNGRWEP